MDVIESANAPKPLGPYSQAISENGLIFVSGIIALDPATGKMVEGGAREQTARILESIKNILEQAGSSPLKVVKSTVYIKEASYLKDMNSVYAGFFGDHKPARATLVAGFVRDDMLVEIDVIASR